MICAKLINVNRDRVGIERVAPPDYSGATFRFAVAVTLHLSDKLPQRGKRGGDPAYLLPGSSRKHSFEHAVAQDILMKQRQGRVPEGCDQEGVGRIGMDRSDQLAQFTIA